MHILASLLLLSALTHAIITFGPERPDNNGPEVPWSCFKNSKCNPRQSHYLPVKDGCHEGEINDYNFRFPFGMNAKGVCFYMKPGCKGYALGLQTGDLVQKSCVNVTQALEHHFEWAKGPWKGFKFSWGHRACELVDYQP